MSRSESERGRGRLTRAVVGMSVGAGLLLVTGVLVGECKLWSETANHTVAWFCSAMSIALVVVAMTCCLCGRMPGRIPAGAAATVYAVVVVVVGAGIAVDGDVLLMRSRTLTSGVAESILEWVGFSVILLMMFVAPRIDRSLPGHCRTCGYDIRESKERCPECGTPIPL